MGSTKIQNENELLRWFEQGKTYAEMRELYSKKYNLEVGISMFANFRRRRGLDLRIARDSKLIPWAVKKEHSHHHSVHMLRREARRRSGMPIPPREEEILDGFLRTLAEDDAVVHYDPDTEQGFFRVSRRPGIDNDLIREPERVTKLGGSDE